MATAAGAKRKKIRRVPLDRKRPAPSQGLITKRRPTESKSLVTGGIGAVLIQTLNLKTPWTTIITAVVGVSPAVFTWIYANGGLVGAIKRFLFGQPQA